MSERKAMIDRTYVLPVTHQCKFLSLSRSSAYSKPQETSQNDLVLMAAHRRTALGLSVCREPHAARPAAPGRLCGRSQACRDADEEDAHRGVLQGARYQPSSSGPSVYPYLLLQMATTRPNHVFTADITYIPMKRGFVYLVAVMDWASR